MKKAKHNYRVTVYLGKANYEKLKQCADILNVSVAAITRLMIDSGMQLADLLESEAKKGGFRYGEQQPEI